MIWYYEYVVYRGESEKYCNEVGRLLVGVLV